MAMQRHAAASQTVGNAGTPMEPAMALALAANFGSAERWREHFLDLAKNDAGDRVTLAFRPRDSTLVNVALTDATGNDVPLLVLVCREPSPAGNAFMAAIDWADVYQRYQRAVHTLSEPFAATPDDVADAVLLDVRRAGVFDEAATMIPGARWRDPACVAVWSAELPSDRDIVVYCVYGHEVGRATALRLRAAGKNARFLHGGIDGWQAAGRPVEPKGEPR